MATLVSSLLSLEAAPFRVTNDGGASWTDAETLAAAINAVDTDSTTDSVVELCEDHELTATTLPSGLTVQKPFTFRSKAEDETTYTLSRATGSVQVFSSIKATVAFTNLVVSGGTTPFVSVASDGVVHFRKGFKLTGCADATASTGPINSDTGSTIGIYDGAEISDCSGPSAGAIYLGGTLYMYGGTITRCAGTANSKEYGGGGISTKTDTGYQIHMSGGTISDCAASSGSSNRGGGAIFLGRRRTYTGVMSCEITGGTITGNKACKGGGVAFFADPANRSQIASAVLKISGNPVIRGNTKLDGTTPSDVEPLHPTRLILAAPLESGAEVGVFDDYASGAEFATFGISEIGHEGSGAEYFFCDGNPVGGKTRKGCCFEGDLVWMNEGDDLNKYALQVSTDGGLAWTWAKTFDAALTLLPNDGTPETNRIRMRKDYEVTSADIRGSYGNVSVDRSFTLYSEDMRRTFDWSKSGTSYFTTGGTHCFSNVVITGMTSMMQTRLGFALHFYDGVLFSNNHVSANAPVYADSAASVCVHPGAVFCGNSGAKGGAIGVSNATLAMDGGLVSNNVASVEGGGIWLDAGATCVMTGGTVTHNRAPSCGGICARGTLRVSGSAVVWNNTLSDGTTASNVGGLTDATKLILTGPLTEDARIGASYADGQMLVAFGVSEIEQGESGSERIFFDGNPVSEKNRVGYCLAGSLVWSNEGEDPADSCSLRVSRDGGQTWYPQVSFKSALQLLASPGTAEDNVIELTKDHRITDDDYAAADRSFTLRSAAERKTFDWSLCSSGFTAGAADLTNCFTNVVITGMTKQMLASDNKKTVWHFCEGVLFTNNTYAGSYVAPIGLNLTATAYVHPGAVFSGNTGGDGSVFVLSGGTLVMDGGVITNNTAQRGGGAIFFNRYKSNTAILSGGFIADNPSPGGYDGAFYVRWNNTATTNEIRVSGSPVVRGRIYCYDEVCSNTVVQVGDLGPTAEIPVALRALTADKGQPAGRTTGAFRGAEQIYAYGKPVLTAVREGDRLVWTDAMVVGSVPRTTTGDLSVSKLYAKQTPDGFVPWNLTGRLTLAEGTTFDLSELDESYLAAHARETFTLLTATSISGTVPRSLQSGAPTGWYLKQKDNSLILRRNNGIAIAILAR